MKIPLAHAAAIATALIVWTCKASAVTFDERWSSLFGVSPMTNESVSAKAEFIPSKEAAGNAERRPRTKYHRVRRDREFRHREWYKGGKRWHYVYSRKRTR